MGGVLKVLLWTVLAAGLAMAIVVGFGLFQLSQIFPAADEGEGIAEEITSELVTKHPTFSVESRADSSFAEVSITITPDGGDLTEPEVSGVLSTLQDLVAEHADSRWDIESTVEGRWDNSPVTITGSDAARWSGLASVLELADGARAGVSVHLDTNDAVLARDLDTERLCGPDTKPRDFFTETVEEATGALTELGWTDPDGPALVYVGSGCEGPLRTSLDLSGEDRLGRVEDLQTVLGTLSDEDVLVGVTVRDSGELELGLEADASDPVAESVVRAWPHGEVWINGERPGS